MVLGNHVKERFFGAAAAGLHMSRSLSIFRTHSPLSRARSPLSRTHSPLSVYPLSLPRRAKAEDNIIAPHEPVVNGNIDNIGKCQAIFRSLGGSAGRDSSGDRMAVVTGASSGIGREVARLLSVSGWEVHNVSRRACCVPGVKNHVFDLSVPQQAHEAAQSLLAEVATSSAPRTMTVVHNASTHFEDRVMASDPAHMAEALNVSVVAPSILNGALARHMSTGSSIIFVGSTLSEKAVAGRLSYVTAKHATVGLMRSSTQDLFGTGIHTACVCPGFTDTPMLQKAMSKAPEEAAAFVSNFVSIGRLLTAEEIAQVILFAIGNPGVNGSVIHANGGQRET
jgi:3-oxoacyl-[acyl-carrier protein] reductase